MISPEMIFNYNDISVKYKRKHSKQDKKHLIVVFSGMMHINKYAFDSIVVENIHADMLWIKDDFDGHNAYYIGHNMSFAIIDAVHALISSVYEELDLSKAQVTLMGFSKGGAAALLYGLKFGYQNILATVPQTKVGSYVKELHPKIFEYITKTGSNDEILHLDTLTTDVLSTDNYLNRNIYIFSSLADSEYKVHIEPHIHEFDKYLNFNLILSNSRIVNAHHMVTRYNMPLILSILYALSEGAPPRFGRVHNGNGRLDSDAAGSRHLDKLREERAPVIDLEKILMKHNRFYPEGVAFLKGYPIPLYVSSTISLIVRGTVDEFRYPLQTVRRNELPGRYYDKYFCDYTIGGFSTTQYRGLDLSMLSIGLYKVYLCITVDNVIEEFPSRSSTPKRALSLVGNHLITIETTKIETLVRVRSTLGMKPKDYHFEVRNQWIRDSRYHVDGAFLVNGVEINEYKDSTFFLVMTSTTETISCNMAMSFRPDLNKIMGNGDYSKSYFATPAYRGIDLSTVPFGTYDVHISLAHGGSLFTIMLNDKIEIAQIEPKVRFHDLGRQSTDQGV